MANNPAKSGSGLSALVPRPLKRFLGMLRRALIYRNYDSSAYWRQRTEALGEARVLWRNEAYNRCYRRRQQELIDAFLPEIDREYRVLDIGCGIGTVAKMLAQHPLIRIDAVDFPEMIAAACRENSSPCITYIASSAEDYFDSQKRYDLVLSSACFSAIRDINSLRQAIRNCAAMTAPGGRMLMLDPFHRWNYLARSKFSSRQVIALMDSLGFTCIRKSGVLFWPYREWLANSDFPPEQIEKHFRRGEKLLKLLGKHLWADYKILGFIKTHRDR